MLSGFDIKSTLTTTMAVMTTPQTAAGEARHTEPVACTLTSAGLAAQAERWERLIARAMTEHAERADGLRLSFRPEPGVEEELRRLVAVENECCPWATWAVETVAGATVLDVRSTGPGLAALHGMFRPG
jgi:MerR family transcriptional regulator, copper efflux regulator